MVSAESTALSNKVSLECCLSLTPIELCSSIRAGFEIDIDMECKAVCLH